MPSSACIAISNGADIPTVDMHGCELAVASELPRLDGHLFDREGECMSCREPGTRTLRGSGYRSLRWPSLNGCQRAGRPLFGSIAHFTTSLFRASVAGFIAHIEIKTLCPAATRSARKFLISDVWISPAPKKSAIGTTSLRDIPYPATQGFPNHRAISFSTSQRLRQCRCRHHDRIASAPLCEPPSTGMVRVRNGASDSPRTSIRA